jgi:hypothetical protein
MLNIYMKDAYYTAFYDIVKDTQSSTGYDLPNHIEAYIVMLLTDFVDRDDIPPASTFTEMYLTLKSKNDAKNLGDTCLFISGVFPEYKKRHGITRRFYQDIGSSSYEMASDMNIELFPVLAKHFVFLSKFIEVTTKQTKKIYFQ